MLSGFAKGDTVDIGLRLLRNQAEKGTFRKDSEQRDKVARETLTNLDRYRETGTLDRHKETSTVNRDKDMEMDTHITEDSRLTNDLDKFMGALTAYCSPKAVIETIASSKDSTTRTDTRY